MLEDLGLNGRSAVVTGGGRGLGRAMAKALAKAGANVLVAARTQAQVDSAVEEIVAEGGRAIAHTADVTDSAAVDAMVDACVGEFGARFSASADRTAKGNVRSRSPYGARLTVVVVTACDDAPMNAQYQLGGYRPVGLLLTQPPVCGVGGP